MIIGRVLTNDWKYARLAIFFNPYYPALFPRTH